MNQHVCTGQRFPLGARVCPDGVNFCVYSRKAEALDLLLFDRAEDAQPARIIPLHAHGSHRTFPYRHIFVPDLKAGQIYAYRAQGPFDPAQGMRFAGDKVLLDPYGRSIAIPNSYDRGAAARPGDNAPSAMKSVVVDSSAYDWEGDMQLFRPFSQSVIYEMHVGGFTRHPSSGIAPELRGTYAGLIEKIPYLKDLGATAVELMPVFQFDEQDAPLGLVNYWGYSPVSFFASHLGYSTSKDPLRALDEFRDMVKALHRAGIEVILDVVYNHTAEGGAGGPTFCFRGLDNPTYYIASASNEAGGYANYSGTGNTLNVNHAVARRMILDSLRYWVRDMHVDGFRFDLASILSRDVDGQPLPRPPILWDIETDPVLCGIKLIAEAWDAAGLYQVGSFFGDNWKEWNGKFRDDVRSFMRGDGDSVGVMVSRIFGSPDMYTHTWHEPNRSINFVTSHDGFTLNDLVSYNDKHNEANGEGNRDGTSDHRSWNHGVEGPTDDPAIESLRNRQVKNFIAHTLLAAGTPMLLMGDEVRRTQRGNNNAYCQNNDVSWFDWALLDRHADVYRFVRMLVAQRLRLIGGATGAANEMTSRADAGEWLRGAMVQLHGVTLNQPDFSAASHSIAFGVQDAQQAWRMHIMLNAHWEPLTFELPQEIEGQPLTWRRWIDTTLAEPDDIVTWRQAPAVTDLRYLVGPRSIVVLIR
jgi:glycogen operon protein